MLNPCQQRSQGGFVSSRHPPRAAGPAEIENEKIRASGQLMHGCNKTPGPLAIKRRPLTADTHANQRLPGGAANCPPRVEPLQVEADSIKRRINGAIPHGVDGADLDKAEAGPGEFIEKFAVTVEPGGHANGIRKVQSHDGHRPWKPAAVAMEMIAGNPRHGWRIHEPRRTFRGRDVGLQIHA